MESYKYLNLVEMEDLKSSSDQIKQSEIILNNMDQNMETILKKFKEEVIESLKKETKTYQRFWLNQYNKEMLTKNANKKNISYLSFENHNLVKLNTVGENEFPKVPTFQKKPTKKSKDLPKPKRNNIPLAHLTIPLGTNYHTLNFLYNFPNS